MFEVTVGLIVFCCLFGAAMLTLLAASEALTREPGEGNP